MHTTRELAAIYRADAEIATHDHGKWKPVYTHIASVLSRYHRAQAVKILSRRMERCGEKSVASVYAHAIKRLEEGGSPSEPRKEGCHGSA